MTAGDKKIDDVMRKFDRESNTRVWTGPYAAAVSGLSAFFSVYCIYMTLFSVALPEVRLTRFVAFIVVIGYLLYPVHRGHAAENRMPVYDIAIMLVGAFSFLYFSFNAVRIIRLATRISCFDVIVAVLGVLAVLELARRCVGLPILCVAGVLVVYAFANQLSWGMGFYQAVKNIAYKLFYTTSGVIGTPVSVCYTYIVLFIIFGAFLEKTGIAKFFIDFANRVAGWSCGGPAKVAVISSALCGMVSGSSVGNTVTTGSVTIPLMKKTGYKPEFAGAVEAAASTGGQIMPPIMGAAAFLMSEYMGIPYSQVALKALLPAILYFTGIFISVHLEARRLGLSGVRSADMVSWGRLLSRSFLLLPLVLLVWLVSSGLRTMQFSAAVSIFAAIAVGFLNPDDRLTFGKIFNALASGARSAVTVAVACAVAGVIAGCITVTGLASVLINGIVGFAGDATIVGLVLTMLCCIVLGMGVPTTANYCIMASTCAPILIQMGIPVVAAHFFVFYFGIVADITPPVALAAYAGSAIADADPMKTGVNATKLAIAAFIVPYVFAFNPALLFVNVKGAIWVVEIVITALLGIYALSVSLGGYSFRAIPAWERCVYALLGLILIIPETITDMTGIVLLVAVSVRDWCVRKRKS